MLEFGRPLPSAPRYRVPPGTFVTACLPTVPDKWLNLLLQAIPDGWGF